MDELKQLLENRNRELQEYREIVEDFISQEIKGSLISTTIREKPANYHYMNKEKIYIPKSQHELVQLLAQKDYYHKVLREVNKEQRALQTLLSKYQPDRILQVYKNLSPYRQTLVCPVTPDDQAFIEQWYQEQSQYANPYPLEGKYYTDHGEQVRSKTEILIANTYYHSGIPYVYEPRIQFKNGRTVYPDFATLNVRTRKTYYHEHHGMMDDPEYSIRAIEKIQMYEKNGYIQGENIYHTFETKDLPYNIQQLHQFIDLKLR